MFLDLLENAGDSPVDQRAGLLFVTMINAGSHDLVTRYFRPTLAMYERLGPRADAAALTLSVLPYKTARQASRVKLCACSDPASFKMPPCRILNTVRSTDSLTLVTATDVSDELRQRKESALRSIKARLAKQGMPLR